MCLLYYLKPSNSIFALKSWWKALMLLCLSTQLSRMEGWVDGIRRGAGPYNSASATTLMTAEVDIALLPQFLFAYKKYQLGGISRYPCHMWCFFVDLCWGSAMCQFYVCTLRCHPDSAYDSWTKTITSDSSYLTAAGHQPASLTEEARDHHLSYMWSLPSPEKHDSPTCDPYL